MARRAMTLGLIGSAAILVGLGTAARAAAPPPPVALVCTLQPGVAFKSGVDRAAVCEVFRRKIEGVTGAAVQLVPAIPTKAAARWVAVDIRAPRPNALEARMTSRLTRTRIVHLPIAIDVMDKALDRRDAETLAHHAAAMLVRR